MRKINVNWRTSKLTHEFDDSAGMMVGASPIPIQNPCSDQASFTLPLVPSKHVPPIDPERLDRRENCDGVSIGGGRSGDGGESCIGNSGISGSLKSPGKSDGEGVIRVGANYQVGDVIAENSSAYDL